MAQLGNTPTEQTIFRLEAAKSFSFNVWLQDETGRALDVTGGTLNMVMKKPPFDSTDLTDADNLIVNDNATLIDAAAGLFRFYLQASDLNHPAGEYLFSIILRTDNYALVVIKGVVELLPNGELVSASAFYPPSLDGSTAALTVKIAGNRNIYVTAGGGLLPGTQNFTDADKMKLDGIQAGAQVNPPDRVPAGGAQGSVLTKLSSQDFIVGWAQPPSGGGGAGLDPTGVPAGYVPTANGTNGWDWEEAMPSTISADIVTDTSNKVMMLPAERTKLIGLTATPAWSSIVGKPNFGTASLLNTNQVLAPMSVVAADIISGVFLNARIPRVTELRGYSQGTTAPSGGTDGDLYLQYT